jgi:hypothetical protein
MYCDYVPEEARRVSGTETGVAENKSTLYDGGVSDGSGVAVPGSSGPEFVSLG